MLVSKKGLLTAAVVGAAIGFTLSTYEDKAERKQVAIAITGMIGVAVGAYLGAKKGSQVGVENTCVHIYLRRNTSDDYREISGATYN